jgi:hypothetical protein
MPVTIDGTAGVISPNMTVTTLTPGSTVGVGTGGILNSSGGGGGGGSGTAGQLAYYAATGTTSVGTNAGTGVITAIGLAANTAGGILVPSAAGTAGQVLLGAGSGASPTWSSTPTLGVVGTTAGTLALAGSTSGSTTLAASAIAGTTTATLPARTGNLMMDGPAFSVYQSAAQAALPAGTPTKISLQTEEFDTNNNFDNATNYRFTPTVAGYYQINGSVQVSGVTTGLTSYIYKNGLSYKQGSYLQTSSSTPISNVGSVIYFNGTTDYIELWAYTVTSLSVISSSSSTFLNGCLIRGA